MRNFQPKKTGHRRTCVVWWTLNKFRRLGSLRKGVVKVSSHRCLEIPKFEDFVHFWSTLGYWSLLEFRIFKRLTHLFHPRWDHGIPAEEPAFVVRPQLAPRARRPELGGFHELLCDVRMLFLIQVSFKNQAKQLFAHMGHIGFEKRP